MRKTAILVLGCASPPYVDTIATIRHTWARNPLRGADIFFVYGVPQDSKAREVLAPQVRGDWGRVATDGVARFADCLVVDCADHIDHQQDCLLRKRLAAFGQLAESGRYDFIYTVCATSYVDQDALLDHVARVAPKKAFQGIVGVCGFSRMPYVSGASMLLSADVARELAAHRDTIIAENQFGYRDDVAIGTWVARHLSDTPLPQIIERIHQGVPATGDGTFQLPNHQGGSINLVMAPPNLHKPAKGVYHYHFHSQGSADMARFHQRYFSAPDMATD
jgi:hypothetical protein